MSLSVARKLNSRIQSFYFWLQVGEKRYIYNDQGKIARIELYVDGILLASKENEYDNNGRIVKSGEWKIEVDENVLLGIS